MPGALGFYDGGATLYSRFMHVRYLKTTEPVAKSCAQELVSSDKADIATVSVASRELCVALPLRAGHMVPHAGPGAG